jgi:hypothetical protein
LEAMIEWVSYWQTDWLTTCSNMDFYSVLYVRKVQFTNCLCMTHENFM